MFGPCGLLYFKRRWTHKVRKETRCIFSTPKVIKKWNDFLIACCVSPFFIEFYDCGLRESLFFVILCERDVNI